MNTSYKKVLEKNWDINSSYFTHNEKYRVTYINEDAKNTIEIYDVDGINLIKTIMIVNYDHLLVSP